MGKNHVLALKLDMSKVYDKVEWSFIKAIMVRLGFVEKWIMYCISIVSYFCVINGEPLGYFTLEIGLCQGDSFYLYLFLLCFEGLYRLLHKKEHCYHILGVSVCRATPTISHLIFIDDSLIFYKTSLHRIGFVESRKSSTSMRRLLDIWWIFLNLVFSLVVIWV